MKQFIYDMIHMTEGEKLVYYWEVWVGSAVFLYLFHVASKWYWERKGKK